MCVLHLPSLVATFFSNAPTHARPRTLGTFWGCREFLILDPSQRAQSIHPSTHPPVGPEQIAYLNRNETLFLNAMTAYIKGEPILSDTEFDALKRSLKEVRKGRTNLGGI